jgi:methylenetetrahydrofolate reductase (NADPH)
MTEAAARRPTVSEMLRGYSIEVHPTHKQTVDGAVERLEAGTEVFLTWIPGTNPLDIVEPSARLRRAGLIPVPHVGARHLESASQLSHLASALVVQAGVDRILIIGGDSDKPAGPYDSSLAVMQTEVFQRAGVTRIAVAGFPEGNPNIPDNLLDEALTAKVKFAQTGGLQVSIVTQFCFKSDPIIAWLQRLRAKGIDVPVRVGLAGPAGVLTLVRYAMRCGIGNSLHALTENPAFAKLLTEKGPEPIIRGIAGSLAGDQESLAIAGLHFYVFGGFKKTVDWINEQRSRN